MLGKFYFNFTCTKASFVWSNRSTAKTMSNLSRTFYLFANREKLTRGSSPIPTDFQSPTQLILCKDSSVPLHRGVTLKNNTFSFHPSLSPLFHVEIICPGSLGNLKMIYCEDKSQQYKRFSQFKRVCSISESEPGVLSEKWTEREGLHTLNPTSHNTEYIFDHYIVI